MTVVAQAALTQLTEFDPDGEFLHLRAQGTGRRGKAEEGGGRRDGGGGSSDVAFAGFSGGAGGGGQIQHGRHRCSPPSAHALNAVRATCPAALHTAKQGSKPCCCLALCCNRGGAVVVMRVRVRAGGAGSRIYTANVHDYYTMNKLRSKKNDEIAPSVRLYPSTPPLSAVRY